MRTLLAYIGSKGQSPLLRQSQLHRGMSNLGVRFAFQTNSMPQLKIQQTPDAVLIVAMVREVIVK